MAVGISGLGFPGGRPAGWLLPLFLVSCGPAGSPDAGGENSDSSRVIAPAIDSGAPRLLPRDEANESFRRFRTELVEALGRRDTTYLLSILAPEIRNSFGDNFGIDGFRDMWRIGDPDSPIWATLTRALELGGGHRSDTVFTAPYVYAFWPDTLDGFTYAAVIGSNVPVHSTPDSAAAVLGTASHSILEVKEWREPDGQRGGPGLGWAQVVLLGGARGWVRGRDIYSPTGWRGIFARRGDRWLLTVFVAGD